MIIADSSYWLALANKNDSYHKRAIELHRELTEPLISTWPVMTETCHLLLHRLGTVAQLRFIQAWIDGAFELFDIRPELDRRILKLMSQYAELPMDLADASLVVLAEELNDGRILSSDSRDFKTYRWKTRKPFKNLLLA